VGEVRRVEGLGQNGVVEADLVEVRMSAGLPTQVQPGIRARPRHLLHAQEGHTRHLWPAVAPERQKALISHPELPRRGGELHRDTVSQVVMGDCGPLRLTGGRLDGPLDDLDGLGREANVALEAHREGALAEHLLHGACRPVEGLEGRAPMLLEAEGEAGAAHPRGEQPQSVEEVALARGVRANEDAEGTCRECGVPEGLVARDPEPR